MTIAPERLDALESIRLDAGHHPSFDDGHCALEVVAWLTGHEHTDRPPCVCPALIFFVQRLNDAMFDSERDRLRPFLPRLVGTASDGRHGRRYRTSCEPRPNASARWLDAAGRTFSDSEPVFVDPEVTPAEIIARASWVSAATRPVGAVSMIERVLAPSVVEVAACRTAALARENGRQVNDVAAVRRLIKRIEREDEFAQYRDLRAGALDDLLAVLEAMI